MEALDLKNMNREDMITALAKKALDMRYMSYTPYSGFNVGAALLTKDGESFGGCNIENAAYGPTNCAERTAIFKAVSEGKRAFSMIAIAGGPKDAALPLDPCPPCGVCLQVMMEFCDPESFEILLVSDEAQVESVLLKDLLPRGFGPASLEA